jgi:hypothetical protein
VGPQLNYLGEHPESLPDLGKRANLGSHVTSLGFFPSHPVFTSLVQQGCNRSEVDGIDPTSGPPEAMASALPRT